VGLADWFSTFCGDLRVTNDGDISTRCKSITKRLNTDFWDTTSETSHSIYVGSYGRHTAIRGFSDVDLIVWLPYTTYEKYNNYASNGQSALLQAVKTSIEKTYSPTKIKADGQVIVLHFSDNMEIEVVPAFENKDDSFTFPNANNGGSWKTTNPRPEIKAIRDRDSACNSNLKPLCRIARAWKDKWSVPIGGLLIDTLAYQFIDGFAHKDKSSFYYDYMCRDFFLWMANQSSTQEYWKAPGSGQAVYGKGLFQYKAKQCYNLALAAIAHETATPKQEWSAKQKWREIFGTNFPS
jgi:hypothetical protein